MMMPDEQMMGGAAGEAAAGICQTCGRPLTRRGPDGECLRCLMSVVFSPGDEASRTESKTGRRLVPGPLSYAHFEVEVGEDRFHPPIIAK